jgi:alkylhydroperoxidase family enzyme
MDFCNYTVHWLAEYYLKLFKSKLPSAFLRLVAAIIVWVLIPQSVKGVGLSEEETISSRKGISTDYKTQAGFEFANQIISNQGRVSDHDYNAVKEAGYNSEEVIEVIALVAKYLFTNYFNHIAGNAIDFPAI